MRQHRWSRLRRTELITAGKALVEDRLKALGCAVTPPRSPTDGKLEVRTPSRRTLEVYVSTQRVGGYAFWTKRRLEPDRHRVAALVLVDDDTEPTLYIVPSEDWLRAEPPLTDRDYEGRASEPEYGISIGRTSLPLLRRYLWTEASATQSFR